MSGSDGLRHDGYAVLPTWRKSHPKKNVSFHSVVGETHQRNGLQKETSFAFLSGSTTSSAMNSLENISPYTIEGDEAPPSERKLRSTKHLRATGRRTSTYSACSTSVSANSWQQSMSGNELTSDLEDYAATEYSECECDSRSWLSDDEEDDVGARRGRSMKFCCSTMQGLDDFADAENCEQIDSKYAHLATTYASENISGNSYQPDEGALRGCLHSRCESSSAPHRRVSLDCRPVDVLGDDDGCFDSPSRVERRRSLLRSRQKTRPPLCDAAGLSSLRKELQNALHFAEDGVEETQNEVSIGVKVVGEGKKLDAPRCYHQLTANIKDSLPRENGGGRNVQLSAVKDGIRFETNGVEANEGGVDDFDEPQRRERRHLRVSTRRKTGPMKLSEEQRAAILATADEEDESLGVDVRARVSFANCSTEVSEVGDFYTPQRSAERHVRLRHRLPTPGLGTSLFLAAQQAVAMLNEDSSDDEYGGANDSVEASTSTSLGECSTLSDEPTQVEGNRQTVAAELEASQAPSPASEPINTTV